MRQFLLTFNHEIRNAPLTHLARLLIQSVQDPDLFEAFLEYMPPGQIATFQHLSGETFGEALAQAFQRGRLPVIRRFIAIFRGMPEFRDIPGDTLGRMIRHRATMFGENFYEVASPLLSSMRHLNEIPLDDIVEIMKALIPISNSTPEAFQQFLTLFADDIRLLPPIVIGELLEIAADCPQPAILHALLEVIEGLDQLQEISAEVLNKILPKIVRNFPLFKKFCSLFEKRFSELTPATLEQAVVGIFARVNLAEVRSMVETLRTLPAFAAITRATLEQLLLTVFSNSRPEFANLFFEIFSGLESYFQISSEAKQTAWRASIKAGHQKLFEQHLADLIQPQKLTEVVAFY